VVAPRRQVHDAVDHDGARRREPLILERPPDLSGRRVECERARHPVVAVLDCPCKEQESPCQRGVDGLEPSLDGPDLVAGLNVEGLDAASRRHEHQVLPDRRRGSDRLVGFDFPDDVAGSGIEPDNRTVAGDVHAVPRDSGCGDPDPGDGPTPAFVAGRGVQRDDPVPVARCRVRDVVGDGHALRLVVVEGGPQPVASLGVERKEALGGSIEHSSAQRERLRDVVVDLLAPEQFAGVGVEGRDSGVIQPRSEVHRLLADHGTGPVSPGVRAPGDDRPTVRPRPVECAGVRRVGLERRPDRLVRGVEDRIRCRFRCRVRRVGRCGVVSSVVHSCRVVTELVETARQSGGERPREGEQLSAFHCLLISPS